jgi:hypothetical protein
MSNLDSVVSAAIEDSAIVPGLSFSLSSQKGASFVRARNWSTFYASGSNIYSVGTGQRTLRFLLSDGGKSMLDCSTVRLNFQITNTDGANPLVLSGRHPACLFYRAQLRVGGSLVEDIQHYGRLVSTLQCFRSPAALASEGITGVGTGSNPLSVVGPTPEHIDPGETRTITCDLPGLGLFASHYLLPIGRFPVELQLELVQSAADVCMPGPLPGPVNLSTSFTIQNATIKADTVMLDSQLNESIDEALLSGKPLSLSLSSWSNQYFTLANIAANAGSWSVLLSRSFSRLQSVFVNFLPTTALTGVWTLSNLFTSWHGGSGLDQNPPNYNFTRDSFRFQLFAGASCWPQVPIQSHSEAYYQLQKTVGQLQQDVGLAIGPTYRSTNFHLALDLEKLASTPAGVASYTGLNTKASSDSLRFQFDNVTSDTTNGYLPGRMYVLCQYNVLCELYASGVVVAD